MGRQIVKTLAVVIRTRRMGETSKLVTLYSEEFGKLKVTAKGARRPKSKFGAALEVMTEVQAVCYLREDRELQILSECDVLQSFPALLRDFRRLSFASAACESVDRITIEQEPNQRLYRCLTGVLPALEEVEPEQIESLFWYFQLRLAEALGYRPELSGCVSCNAALSGCEAPYFSAGLGGGLCSDCHRAEAVPEDDGYLAGAAIGGDTHESARARYSRSGGHRVAGDSLGFLARLQNIRTYRKEAIPPEPPGCGEIRAMLGGFLEYHGGAGCRLKALEFLH